MLHLGICSNQERLWTEIVDDPAMEEEARQGGLTPTFINERLHLDIQVILSRLIGKADQLIGNETTNLAESWMNIRMKFDGGKVMNRSQSGSWEHRCMGAGLQQNMGREWGPQAWRQMTHSSPNKIYTDTAQHAAKIARQNKKRKATEEVKQQRRRSKYAKKNDTAAARSAYSRHDNGIQPEQVAEDISPESLEELKSSFYRTRVAITQEEARQIEEETRDQMENEKWSYERRKRITASVVGGIAKMREKTKRSKKVESLLYSTFRGNQATRYGQLMEQATIEQYVTYQRRHGHPDLRVNNCGLFISRLNNWLAATPDGIVHDPNSAEHPFGLVEIKNPFLAKDMDLDEASCNSSFCLELDRKTKTRRLKHRHDYYFQVQCQLYCTDKTWCDFVVRTNKDIHIERIQRDSKWFGVQLAKLRKFYFEALLPELACPRFRRGGIREPATS